MKDKWITRTHWIEDEEPAYTQFGMHTCFTVNGSLSLTLSNLFIGIYEHKIERCGPFLIRYHMENGTKFNIFIMDDVAPPT